MSTFIRVLRAMPAPLVSLLLVSGCSAHDAEPTPSPAAAPSASAPAERSGTNTRPDPATAPSGDATARRFDGLRFALTFRTTTVRRGGTLRTRASVVNNSSRLVIDPDCRIAEGRYALIPRDQPDAELWVRPMTDCQGQHRMPPGYRATWTGPDFVARTKYGKPLPPGEYLAVLEIEGLSQRLEYPVTVTR